MLCVRLVAMLFAAGFCLLAGAAQTRGQKQPIQEVSLVESNLCEVALAIVDGKPLTAAEVKESVEVSSAVADLSKRGRILKKPEGRRANTAAMRIVPQLISAKVLEAELDRRNIVATTNSDAKVLANYNRIFKSDAKSVDELAARFGEIAPAFKRQFAHESRYQELFASESLLEVTERDINRCYRALTNRMEKCREINEAATNKLENAWRELQAGASWENVATNTTEDALLNETLADNWKEWKSLKLGKIEPMELMVAVSKLKPGEFTRPMDIEEGLAIVKLVDRDGEFCTLARILVRMAVEVEFPDREVVIRKIRKEKIAEFQRELLPELRAKAKIEYPFGKKFKFKIWDDSKPKKRQ